MTDLGTFGGTDSFSTALNDTGQITGYFSTLSGGFHAFLHSNGQAVDLGTLPGYARSTGLGINNAGQVVGRAYNSSNSSRAFVYDKGQLRDLGTLGGNESSASGINDSGQNIGPPLWSTHG